MTKKLATRQRQTHLLQADDLGLLEDLDGPIGRRGLARINATTSVILRASAYRNGTYFVCGEAHASERSRAEGHAHLKVGSVQRAGELVADLCGWSCDGRHAGCLLVRLCVGRPKSGRQGGRLATGGWEAQNKEEKKRDGSRPVSLSLALDGDGRKDGGSWCRCGLWPGPYKARCGAAGHAGRHPSHSDLVLIAASRAKCSALKTDHLAAISGPSGRFVSINNVRNSFPCACDTKVDGRPAVLTGIYRYFVL